MYWDVALWSAGIWAILSLAAGQLTEQEKSTIVDMHNKLRSQVQPSAAFMQKVEWNETLSLEVAEAYAVKCIWKHNPELRKLLLGENLFITTGDFNATEATVSWFEENVDYNYENKFCPADKMCGHYTQMVWANTNKIGCATHFCETVEGISFKKATILVCNYSPPGNFRGQYPYVSGEPCSKCPENLPVCEEKICVSENSLHPSEEPGVTEEPTVLPEPGVTEDTEWDVTEDPEWEFTEDPTVLPERNVNEDPTVLPERNVNEDPTVLPERDINEDPTVLPERDVNEDPTVLPERDVNEDPTVLPERNVNEDPTVLPERDINEDPTVLPERDVNEDPTVLPERDVNEDPTVLPERNVNEDPTVLPERDVNEDPTVLPERNVNEDPTVLPERDVNEDPTVLPERDVNENPTVSPESLH